MTEPMRLERFTVAEILAMVTELQDLGNDGRITDTPTWKRRTAEAGPDEWETCLGCEREYRFGHICRMHDLCGRCHPR